MELTETVIYNLTLCNLGYAKTNWMFGHSSILRKDNSSFWKANKK